MIFTYHCNINNPKHFFISDENKNFSSMLTKMFIPGFKIVGNTFFREKLLIYSQTNFYSGSYLQPRLITKFYKFARGVFYHLNCYNLFYLIYDYKENS